MLFDEWTPSTAYKRGDLVDYRHIVQEPLPGVANRLRRLFKIGGWSKELVTESYVNIANSAVACRTEPPSTADEWREIVY